jgi:hypothetical protein
MTTILLLNSLVARADYMGERPYDTKRPKALVSVFDAASHKPSLGRLFAAIPTLHLLLHQLPRSTQPPDAATRKGENVWICEVLEDNSPLRTKTSGNDVEAAWAMVQQCRRRRTGRWCALDAVTISGRDKKVIVFRDLPAGAERNL